MNTISKSNHTRGVIFAFLLLMIPLSLNAQIIDVSIPGFNFDPADLAVETGATVRWTNNHTVNHTSTSLDGIWDSGTLAPGESYSYTFNNPGYYEYECTFHPSMTGVIRVLELFYSIPDLYANMQAVEGQVVSVLGEFSEGNDSKLVTNYARYISRELMPQHTIIFIEGALPPLDYWYGGMVLVTGTVSLIPNPNPIYPDDTVYISINATGYELINEGKFDPYLPKDEDKKFDINQPRDCDSCKFGILISGGGDAANNHPGFWEDIENLYKHKVNNEDYCPQNVKVIYYDGNSGDTSEIPDSMVSSATEANIQAAHDEIARKIAECSRNGKDATVQKMVSNHGEDGDGIVLLDTNYLTGGELREQQQKLIDSCCKYMYDEMTQCFGGQIIDSLKDLDDKNKTEIHANSAASSDALGWGDGAGSPFLLKKIERLAAGDDYESAVDSARSHYRRWLEAFRDTVQAHKDRVEDIKDSVGPQHPWIPILDSLLAEDSSLISDADSSISGGSPSWVRYQFKEYCDWKKVKVPPGGEIKLKFKGEGGCGNVTLYEEQADGSKTKVKKWNWNLPGSAGYETGNDERVHKVPEGSTGVFWIHNDNGQFSVTIDVSHKQSAAADSPSNGILFANISNGGNDGSPLEFSEIIAPFYSVPGIHMDGFPLTDLPMMIGPCGGVEIFQGEFLAEDYNPWWDDMEIYINVLDVLQPGILLVQCPSASVPDQIIEITGPGEYVVPVGAVTAPGPGAIIFNAMESPGMEPCIILDSWALRTLVPTWEGPVYVCGDANGDAGVNISDAVWIINYVFIGGDPPEPYEAGDANCDGTVNVSDAVWVINYVFIGGFSPCDTNGDGIPDC